ncbi:Ribonucleoside-diphosphate reductase 1 subunit alpha [Yokenella regensburgei]|nr:Ribonucleoside-diphosphate reductase 1 subunit alpha [Yokenella regensburgei]
MQQLLKDLLTAYKFGVKTLYYQKLATVRKMRRTIWRHLFRMMAAKAAHVRFDE